MRRSRQLSRATCKASADATWREQHGSGGMELSRRRDARQTSELVALLTRCLGEVGASAGEAQNTRCLAAPGARAVLLQDAHQLRARDEGRRRAAARQDVLTVTRGPADAAPGHGREVAVGAVLKGARQRGRPGARHRVSQRVHQRTAPRDAVACAVVAWASRGARAGSVLVRPRTWASGIGEAVPLEQPLL